MSAPPTPILALGPVGGLSDARLFELFLGEVAYEQLADWLPETPQTILDLSLQAPALLGLMVDRGHTVIHVDAHARLPDIAPAPGRSGGPGRMYAVRADPRLLQWLRDDSVDVVVAEGMLSESLAAELTLDDLGRVLKPGGRLLLSADSLVAGLARLADQGRWAELADVPAADVVLVPHDDGSVSRCFWPEELAGMLSGAGFDVEWIRPRTVLAEYTVAQALRSDATQLHSLVNTELALSIRREGESIGGRLVASAHKA